MRKRQSRRAIPIVVLTLLLASCGPASTVGSPAGETAAEPNETSVETMPLALPAPTPTTAIAAPVTVDPPPSMSIDMPQTTLAPVIEAVTCALTFTPHDTGLPEAPHLVVVNEPGQQTTPIGDLLFATSLVGESFARGELTLSISQSPDFPVVFSARYRLPANPYINAFEASQAGFTGVLTVTAPTTLSQLSFSCTAM